MESNGKSLETFVQNLNLDLILENLILLDLGRLESL